MTEKREKPLGLNMPFEEALERFIGTDPAELPDNVKLRQKEGPPKRPLAPKGVDETTDKSAGG
jgi:hypothetical protein